MEQNQKLNLPSLNKILEDWGSATDGKEPSQFVYDFFIDKLTKKQEEELSLEDYLDAIWMQKQFDDMLVIHADVCNRLKKQPFQPNWLKQRDALAHDINVLQPMLSKAGVKVAKYIEKKYGFEFAMIRMQVEPTPEQKPTMILTGQEKT